MRGLHVEIFVRVLHSLRVNLNNVNNTNVVCCVRIESPFILVTVAVSQFCVTKAVSVYKMQFLVELLVDIGIVVSCLVG